MADRASSAPARRAATLVLAGLCAACAGTGDPAGYSIVTQDKFDFMECKEIVGQRAGLIGREKELAGLVEKADASPGGFLVSITAYRSELTMVRGLLQAANRAAQKHGCDKPKP